MCCLFIVGSLLFIVYWLLFVRCWLLVIGHCLLVGDCWILLVVSIICYLRFENNTFVTGEKGGLLGHLWLEVDNKILDMTTYQLPKKAQKLDFIDKKNTSVKWSPDYIYSSKDKLTSIQKVINGTRIGSYGYKKIKTLEHNDIDITNNKDTEFYLEVVKNIVEKPTWKL